MAASVTHVGQFQLSYDRDADVLYVSLGSLRFTYTNEDEQGFLIRKDPKSSETVGVTILDYEEHFRQLPDLYWLATKPLRRRPDCLSVRMPNIAHLVLSRFISCWGRSFQPAEQLITNQQVYDSSP